jgi:hypothetical protein
MRPTLAGRYLVLIFEMKEKGIARVITGWDMSESENLFLQGGMHRSDQFPNVAWNNKFIHYLS